MAQQRIQGGQTSEVVTQELNDMFTELYNKTNKNAEDIATNAEDITTNTNDIQTINNTIGNFNKVLWSNSNGVGFGISSAGDPITIISVPEINNYSLIGVEVAGTVNSGGVFIPTTANLCLGYVRPVDLGTPNAGKRVEAFSAGNKGDLGLTKNNFMVQIAVNLHWLDSAPTTVIFENLGNLCVDEYGNWKTQFDQNSNIRITKIIGIL